MKYKSTVLLFFVSTFVFSQIIEWSPNTKLNKNDFRGKIPDNTINHAGTASNIGYEVVSTSIWTGRIKMRTYAIFSKSESWLNEDFYTEDLLNHEQKHFDITQIFACKLQRSINKEIRIPQDYYSKFSTLNTAIGDEYLKFQEKYDAETDHGTKLDVQKNYDKMIGLLLEENCQRK
ncbi:hypothetical protein [Chryseobacterium bernardetii]|uniref:DUF922 domain-containing protein n=1 Tax=Chryseobacterium bernardetii TaxID=1241978 RepID=UPI0016297FC8|nr:hypothetical protein [Chryseobacterium bernardetii]